MRRSLPDGFEPRETCARCRRPARVCYCRHLPSLETRTRVVLLQHPRERDKAIGTAHMASLCLVGSELHVGVSFESSRALAEILADPTRPAALLWPGEGAIDVLTSPPAEPITLVVVDGTWSQAKKLVRMNPALAALPRYAFVAPEPSEYRIRREPDDAFVSTIEALVLVLGVLEGDRERFRALLAPFRAMVDAQIALTEQEGGRGRHKKDGPRPPPRPRVPQALVSGRESVVCVTAEANAWPYRARPRSEVRRLRAEARQPGGLPPGPGQPGGLQPGPGQPGGLQPSHREELVHWVAHRLGTSETLDLVVRPENPMAPGTPGHIGIPADVLAAGVSRDELFARWQAFSRPGDVVCAWGSYALDVFTAAGGALPRQRIDLRNVARDLGKGRVGPVERFLASIDPDAGPTPPLARGRAGERLATLVRVADRLGDVGDVATPASREAARR